MIKKCTETSGVVRNTKPQQNTIKIVISCSEKSQFVSNMLRTWNSIYVNFKVWGTKYLGFSIFIIYVINSTYVAVSAKTHVIFRSTGCNNQIWSDKIIIFLSVKGESFP